MKYRVLSLYVALVAGACALAPVAAWAAKGGEDEDTVKLEARLEGYTQGVRLENSSTALTWMMFIFLATVCLAVLFKNAKRTHLD